VFLLLEIEKVKEKIAQLDESEAKSLLFMIYARLDTAINGIGGAELIKETVVDLFDIYKRLPDKKEPNYNSSDRLQ
jgi:ArsR family metal-binding transcriptional regulator